MRNQLPDTKEEPPDATQSPKLRRSARLSKWKTVARLS